MCGNRRSPLFFVCAGGGRTALEISLAVLLISFLHIFSRLSQTNGGGKNKQTKTKQKLSPQDENKLLKNMPKAKRRALLKKKDEKADPRKKAVKNQLQMKGRTRSRMRIKV